MHKNFAEWYRLVRIEPNGDALEKRWAGVEEWSSSLQESDDAVLETVRIFQDLPAITSREEFLAAFRKHDPAFPQRNELELRVLAGAALVKCVQLGVNDDNGEFLRASVIAGTALEASRLRASDPQLGEVVVTVVQGLHDIARYQRKRIPFNTPLISSKTEAAVLEAMQLVPAAGDWIVLRTHVAPVLQAVLDGVRRSESALKDAAHNLRCADEETNILWWLEGGCSRDLNKPWNSLKEETPLMAGWELADLTDVALGPQDVAALLERVVTLTKEKSKDQPIHIYVNAVSDEWAKERTAPMIERALDLTPLSLALSQRAKSDRSSWQQYFEKTSGIAPTRQLAPEVAAKQAYVEAVLQRTLSETED
ncbi:GTPase-associated system all-helical protein GASH [Corallococcus exiguus]|uniref:GTPase-associated system all-helical protein GASH n=1 Tax=Corallococcus exiguus TaxID=83462 RepID=UPI003DA38202